MTNDTVEKVARLRALYLKLCQGLPKRGESYTVPIYPGWQYAPKEPDDPAVPTLHPTVRYWTRPGSLTGVREPHRVEALIGNGLAVKWFIIDGDGRVHEGDVTPLITAEFDEPFDHPIIPGVNDHD